MPIKFIKIKTSFYVSVTYHFECTDDFYVRGSTMQKKGVLLMHFVG